MTSYGGVSSWALVIGRNFLRTDVKKLPGTPCKSRNENKDIPPHTLANTMIYSLQNLSRCQRLILEWGHINLTALSRKTISSYYYFPQPVTLTRLKNAGCPIEEVFPPCNKNIPSQPVEISENCFVKVFTEDRLRATHNALLKIIETLHEENIEYILDSGSVIGSWRHHGPIPYDDDIDIRIMREDKPRVRNILETLAMDKSNSMSFKDTEAENQHWKVGYMCQSTRDVNTKNGAFLLSDCLFQIDIFFNWFCGDGKYMCFLEPPRQYPLSIIYPLQRRPFVGLMLPTYRDVESYLKLTYSSDMSVCQYYTHQAPSENKCLKPIIPCYALRDRFSYVERVAVYLYNTSTSSAVGTSMAPISSSSSISVSSTASNSAPLLGFLEYLIDVDKIVSVYFDCHWFCD